MKLKHELKHIGPIPERKIYDSWEINGYLITLHASIMGGIGVKLFQGNEGIRWYPSDATYNVLLFFINNCIWAADNDGVMLLPDTDFHQTAKEYEENKLYKECPAWEKFTIQFKIQDFPYITTINEPLIMSNLDAIRKICDEELAQEMKIDKAERAKKRQLKSRE